MKVFAIDFSSILYLSLAQKHHTNTYRFTMELTEAVDPGLLQQAVDRIYRRFPTIIAGFRPDFFRYTQVPVSQSPRVMPDTGFLITMDKKELEQCAFRVLYRDCSVSMEAFHALTDGYGAVAVFSTMMAEYLRLKYHITIPDALPLLPVEEAPAEHELEDSYVTHQGDQPLHLPSRYAYQLPAKPQDAWQPLPTVRTYPIQNILAIARRHRVSVTALISTVMADAIMELQKRKVAPGHRKPVRIMIPSDLRRAFPSRTLRNFILYALPTMEPGEEMHPLTRRLKDFHRQLQQQLHPERLANIMAYHVRTQSTPLFRWIPRWLKCGFMRLAYRFFGESNSCITLTNLGTVQLPAPMGDYVAGVQVYLTPRVHSPYNCAVISYGDRLGIHLTRFSPEPELEEIFFPMLEKVLSEA